MSKINKITLKDVSKQSKYKIEESVVYTPHEIYEAQNTFIAYILKCLNQKTNALIQSPTGTGKTLSLLCSTLSWAYEYQTRRNEPPPQIIYASRTHAQLKQVVSEINKLCYQVKISILSSRDQSCANDDLKLLRGQDKELECRLRIAQRKGLNCNLYQSEAYYQKQGELGKIMDLQEITLKGKLEGFCPFFYERYSKVTANIVLIPYNYLFDKKIWSNQEGFRLEGSILILDEAHNIQSVCEQFREYSINLNTLARAMHQADQLRLQKLNQNKNKLDPGVFDKVRMMKVATEDIEINASYIQIIYEYIQTLDIGTDSTGLLFTVKEFSEMLDRATEKSQFGTLSRNIKELIKSFENFRADMLFIPFWAFENWMKFIEKISEFTCQSRGERKGISQFTIQIAYEGADIKISLHCLDPSSGFKEVIQQHKPRSIILTSGTLSPLKVWPLELGVQFAQPVSCAHLLSPEQVNTIILGVGPSGKPLETKYENRKNMKLYEDIGEIICQIVENTPNGVVVLFPSYSFLQDTKNHLTTQKIMTKLYNCKNIYFQRKDASDFTTTLERYMKEAQTEKGALLFALVRGKVSEGLDFAHKKCRAVVLVGVPFPYSKDVKVMAKMKYLDDLNNAGEKTLTGSQWYLSETIRAVNQGIGRLIRTPDDYGTVYLIDSRFAKPDIESQLASWARLSLTKINNYGQFIKKVHQINKTKQKNEINAIQSQMGLTSVTGVTLGPQFIVPPKTIRGSISRVLPGKTPEQIMQQSFKNKTLKDIVSTLKTENLQKREEVNIEQLMAKAQNNRLDYQKKIFMRKRLDPNDIYNDKDKPLPPPPRTEVPILTEETEQAPEKGYQLCAVCRSYSRMINNNTCVHSLCRDCWDKCLSMDLRCPLCRIRIRKNFLIVPEPAKSKNQPQTQVKAQPSPKSQPLPQPQPQHQPLPQPQPQVKVEPQP